MAIIEVKVPQLSESVAEATLLQWKKKPGDAMAQDEILIEIETDKVVLEVPAPTAGVLASDRQGRRQHGHERRADRDDRLHRQGNASPRRRLPRLPRQPPPRLLPLRAERSAMSRCPLPPSSWPTPA